VLQVYFEKRKYEYDLMLLPEMKFVNDDLCFGVKESNIRKFVDRYALATYKEKEVIEARFNGLDFVRASVEMVFYDDLSGEYSYDVIPLLNGKAQEKEQCTKEENMRKWSTEIEEARIAMEEKLKVVVPSAAKFAKGEEVEGKFMGAGNWFLCDVEKVYLGGSGGREWVYDVNYKNNVKGAGRKEMWLRKKQNKITQKVAKFVKGEEVEGNYAGAGNWFLCNVEKVYLGGSGGREWVYDVVYKNNVKGAGTKEMWLRQKDVAFTDNFMVGKRCTCNYKNQGQLFKAKITSYDRRNKTYSVIYDNNVKELGVTLEQIKMI